MKRHHLLTCTALAVLTMFYVLSCSDTEKKSKGLNGAPQSVEALQSVGALQSGIISDSLFLATAGSLALNNPDQFNWEVFVRICRKAPDAFQTSINNHTTNNAIWETWADDRLTFPPNPDPRIPPKFPTTQSILAKKLTHSTQQSLRQQSSAKLSRVDIIDPTKDDSLNIEEVRRNKESFDYIIQNDLWYKEGLAKNFAERTPPPNAKTYIPKPYTPIEFPVGAIEIKAMWKVINDTDKPKFHWNYDANGKLFGMTAFHIMTKATPNWTWATWEWVDNPGRCANMGCHDAFGVIPADVEPHEGATGMHSPSKSDTANKGKYPGGELTDALKQLFEKFGLGDEWTHYRLKGSQIDWIDATGRPTFVGNSITEDGFVNTSSCITCHANASFDKNGDANQSTGFDNIFTDSQYGAVDPRIFWSNGKPILLQSDFVWGIFRAHSVKK